MHACRDLAIRQKASAFYEPAVIDSWLTNGNPDVFDRDRRGIEGRNWLYFVYEENGDIKGMASFSPAERVMGRLYVIQGASGAAQALLAHMVQLSKQQDCPYLDFDSSLNARAFYERNGAVVLEEFISQTRPGLGMKAVKMRLNIG